MRQTALDPNSCRYPKTYHVDADDLAVGLLDLAELHQEVPESRSSNHHIGSEHPHAVQLGGGIGLGGQMAPDHLEFVETPWIPTPLDSTCSRVLRPRIFPA